MSMQSENEVEAVQGTPRDSDSKDRTSNVETLSDSAHKAKPEHARTLAWVGMGNIASVLRLADLQLPALAKLEVSLDVAHARGIHMSRLYAELDQQLSQNALSLGMLASLLPQLRASQQNLSQKARLRLDFQLPLRRQALRSHASGWRHYPIQIIATLAASCTLELEFQLQYSSTCPCSASLARQAIQQNFLRQFPAESTLSSVAMHSWLGQAESISATPHAQRSELRVTLKLAPELHHDHDPDGRQLLGLLAALIEAMEVRLHTPVQTAVKRADEQAFAELNGQHPMFVEDAVRSVATWLDNYPRFVDFRVQTTHLESLHAHDALAMAVKGVAGGYG